MVSNGQSPGVTVTPGNTGNRPELGVTGPPHLKGARVTLGGTGGNSLVTPLWPEACPACGRAVDYDPDMDRYSHADGSDNDPCRLRILRGSLFDPMCGPRIRPAWGAAAATLRDRQWHEWTELVTNMTASSDIKPKTASNLIHNAIKAGWLQQKGQHPNREVRVTESGAALRIELA